MLEVVSYKPSWAQRIGTESCAQGQKDVAGHSKVVSVANGGANACITHLIGAL